VKHPATCEAGAKCRNFIVEDQLAEKRGKSHQKIKRKLKEKSTNRRKLHTELRPYSNRQVYWQIVR
jgi:hypothetical protein